MKKHLLTTAGILFFYSILFSQAGVSISPVAKELFKNVRTKLTTLEMNKLATQLGFVLSGNEALPFAADKESREFPFSATVYPADMNKDGREEVFVLYGNSFTSGNTGSSIVLFIKNPAGIYQSNLGFPGLAPDLLTTISKGYPDLLIGGPGFEYPVWRWNGKSYAYSRYIKDADYEKVKKTSLEEYSSSYQKSLKK